MYILGQGDKNTTRKKMHIRKYRLSLLAGLHQVLKCIKIHNMHFDQVSILMSFKFKLILQINKIILKVLFIFV